MTAQATSLTVAFGRHGIHPTDAPGFKSVEQLQIVPKMRLIPTDRLYPCPGSPAERSALW